MISGLIDRPYKILPCLTQGLPAQGITEGISALGHRPAGDTFGSWTTGKRLGCKRFQRMADGIKTGGGHHSGG